MCDRELAIDILLLFPEWTSGIGNRTYWSGMCNCHQSVFPFLRKIPSEAFVAYSQKIG